MEALVYYKKVDGKIDNSAPTAFLSTATIEYLYDSKKDLRVSLYKALLFINIAVTFRGSCWG